MNISATRVMNHSAFINELDTYGLKVRVASFVGEASTYKLTLNGLPISSSHYEFFGYYCGGVYAQCNRTQKEDFTTFDFANAIAVGIGILNERANIYRKEPGFHAMRDYIAQRPFTSKVTREAAKRVFALMKEDWQKIRKHREQDIATEDKNLKIL